MPGLDAETIRYALKTAREYGFTSVRLEVDGERFQARLGEDGEGSGLPGVVEFEEVPSASIDPPVKTVIAPWVGYCGEIRVSVGQSVKVGDVVGTIMALGLPNDIESAFDGEISEIQVRQGEPVQYGQAIATIRSAS